MVVQMEGLAQALAEVREKKPVVHTITNWVTASDVANALHSIGARPVMAFAPEEVKEIVSGADALVLNLGTPDTARLKAMLAAGYHANGLGRPVLFDPVGVSASSFRMDASRSILSELKIAIIRGNRAEIGALAGMGGELRGVDGVTGPADPVAAARTLGQRTGAVVTISGAQDLIVGHEKMARVDNGHPIMGQMTGTGCMLTAVIGAFAAVEEDLWMATVGAVAFFGLAGERAALRARGPGTFKAALLDALFELGPEDLKTGAKVRD